MSSKAKSRAAVLVKLFFDGILLLCFVAQTFLLGCLLAYGHLPLPTKWVSHSLSQQLPAGFSITADSYSLTLDGRVRLKNVELQFDGIQQDVFRATDAHVEFGIGWDRKKFLYPKELVLSDGILRLPAIYSPSGKHSAILERIALRLLPTEDGIRIDSFAALHEDIRLRGRINWAIPAGSVTSGNVRQQADLFFKQVAQILKQKPRFDGLTRPSLFFQIDSANARALNVFSRISSRAYHHAKLQATNLTLEARLSLEDQTLVNQSPILFKADTVELPAHNTRAAGISAKVDGEEWEALLNGDWPEMEFVARTLAIEGIQLESPRIKLSPQHFPEIAFAGQTSGLKGAVRFSGSINADTRAARVQAVGSIDLRSIAPTTIVERLPEITTGRPPYYNLNLDFKPGLVLNKAALRARIDALEIADLQFDHIRFRSAYSDGKYSIDQLYLRRDWQWLDLGFKLDRSTNDYALTLKGLAEPNDYNDLLPRWWGAIFQDFDFAQVESGLADFVIYGNTARKAADFFFGHAAARKVGYKGIHVDAGELFVRGRGTYAEVHRLNARSGEGFVRGDIRFTSRLDEVRGPVSVRMDLDTKLPLPDAKKLFDDDIAAILSDFETDALPRTTLQAAIFNQAYPEFDGLSHVDMNASCAAPISYRGLPLEYLDFQLFGRKDETYLRNIHFGYAGGVARAEADILTTEEGPAQTRLQLSLQAARQHQAISQLTRLKTGGRGKSTPEKAPAEGLLNFKLHAQGPVNAPLRMHGFGSFQIENDNLHAIQLFGPLSKLLQNTRLNFTSFGLNEMVGRFALANGTVNFQDLQMTGPRTRIEAPGTMQLDDFSLAMRVSVFLFGNAGNPDSNLRKFGDFITRPIPNLLEFELTGTPDNQNWRSLYDPRKFIPQF